MNRERFSGSLLGVAVGDALGQPIEAFPAERLHREYGEIRDFMAGDPRLPLPLGAGQWTDDTQMTLDITRSILRVGRVDGADLAREFLADHEAEGIRFSGFTVKYSLLRLKKGMSWERSGLDDDKTQGNGSAMRVAPVGLLDYQRLDRLAADARLSSIVTHRHAECIAGAQAVAYLVARAAAGTLDVQTAIADVTAFIGPCRVAEQLHKAKELLSQNIDTASALAAIGTTGWVVHTVAAAAYCFLKTPDDFERSIMDAVMGGEDADTTAAVCGGISGAYNGEQAIPLRWREQVERGEEIRQVAFDLWELVTNGVTKSIALAGTAEVSAV